MAYEAVHNLITLTDVRSNSHTFEYDLLNRCIKFNYPDSIVSVNCSPSGAAFIDVIDWIYNIYDLKRPV